MISIQGTGTPTQDRGKLSLQDDGYKIPRYRGEQSRLE